MAKKRRPRVRLTPADADSIRLRYQLKLANMPQLAAEFGVAPSTICRIVNSKARTV